MRPIPLPLPRRHVAVAAVLLLVGALPAAPAEEDLESSVARMAKIGACWSPSLSPDGEHLAFVSNLNGVPQVWLVESSGGFPRLVTALDDQVGGVSWSPDGERLVFTLAPGGGMNQQLYLLPPEGGEPRLVTDGGKVNNWFGGWSRDGRLLALSSNRRSPAAMDVQLLPEDNLLVATLELSTTPDTAFSGSVGVNIGGSGGTGGTGGGVTGK